MVIQHYDTMLKVSMKKVMFNAFALYFLGALFALFPFPLSAEEKTSKVFILSGEASGDYIGAWYLEKFKQENPTSHVTAIGGPALVKQGAHLYKNYTDLTLGFVGLFSFLRHLPNRWSLNKEIARYIIDKNFTHIVLVDCPLTNIPLARTLKKENPSLHITYVAPPELWIWGKWRIDSWLSTYCDRIVVIYPFEVNWYREQGLPVEWLGYPYAQELKNHLSVVPSKEKKVALLPGSRYTELVTMLPIFKEVVEKLNRRHPELHFITLRPTSISLDAFAKLLRQNGLLHKVKVIDDTDENKYKELASCCLALSKPGTVTLLLGLLQVPTVITYKTSWFTYFAARLTLQVPYVGLPNLLLKKEVCKELIQSACTSENITHEALSLYTSFSQNTSLYHTIIKDLQNLPTILKIDGTLNNIHSFSTESTCVV